MSDCVNIDHDLQVTLSEEDAVQVTIADADALEVTITEVVEVNGSTVGERTTILTMAQSFPANSVFMVGGVGVGYAIDGDVGNLTASQSMFDSREEIQLFLNGVNLIKGQEVHWVSQTSFRLDIATDTLDKIKIIS